MFKRLLMVLVLGALLVGTLGISAGTMIADRAIAEDQTQTDDGGIVKHVMTKVFESGFKVFINLIPPDKLANITIESLKANPDAMNQIVSRLETKMYTDTVNVLMKENPMFISDMMDELDEKAISDTVNVLMKENPMFISDMMGGLDAKAISKSVNALMKENPRFMSNMMGELDSKSLAELVNALTKKNPAFMSEVAGQVDTEPFVKPMVTLFEENPDIVVSMMEEIDEETLNIAMSKAFGKMRSVDMTMELPPQTIEGVLILPPEVARIVGQDKIKVKMANVGTGPITYRMENAKIHIEKKGE